MPRLAAGILLYRRITGRVEVFLVHPGGPFWAKKDDGAWSLPKGEYVNPEDPLSAAKREFKEETGSPAPDGEFLALGEVKYGNKQMVAWAVEGDARPGVVVSNTFEMEWPPNSGKIQTFPEVDKTAWFSASEARQKLLKGQVELLDRLVAKIG